MNLPLLDSRKDPLYSNPSLLRNDGKSPSPFSPPQVEPSLCYAGMTFSFGEGHPLPGPALKGRFSPLPEGTSRGGARQIFKENGV